MKNKKMIIAGLLAAAVVVGICVFAVIMLNKNDTKQSQPTTTDFSDTEISLVSPSGAPALGLVSAIADPNIKLNYEIVDGADVLGAEFTANEKDLIIAPINVGVNMIKNGAEYELLAVVSWGNLSIVGDRSTYNGNIAAFSEAAVPGKVLEYVKDEFNEEVTIDYYASVAEVAPLLSQGRYGAALLAEPVKTKITNANESLTVLYDIQELYEDKSGLDRYPQAAIFVSKDAIADKTEAILNLTGIIQNGISAFSTDPSALKNTSVDITALGFDDIDLLVDAYPRMALDLVYGTDCVEEVKTFLALFDIEYTDTMYVK